MHIIVNQSLIHCHGHQNLLTVLRHHDLAPPSLCSLPGLKNISVCRLCLVECGADRTIQMACSVQISEGLQVFTETPNILILRRELLSLMLMEHGQCRQATCELCLLAETHGLRVKRNYAPETAKNLNDYLSWNATACIFCERCIRSCTRENTLARSKPRQPVSMLSENCTGCGDCVSACPTGSIHYTTND